MGDAEYESAYTRSICASTGPRDSRAATARDSGCKPRHPATCGGSQQAQQGQQQQRAGQPQPGYRRTHRPAVCRRPTSWRSGGRQSEYRRCRHAHATNRDGHCEPPEGSRQGASAGGTTIPQQRYQRGSAGSRDTGASKTLPSGCQRSWSTRYSGGTYHTHRGRDFYSLGSHQTKNIRTKIHRSRNDAGVPGKI